MAVKNAGELPVAFVAQLENLSKKLLFFLAIAINILNFKPKKSANVSHRRLYHLSIGVYNLSLTFKQFKSSNAAVNLLTKFSSPLRNQTRGS